MKVIINKCYGGFGISPKALLELIKRGAGCVEKLTLYKFYCGNTKREDCKEYIEKQKSSFLPFIEGYDSHHMFTALQKDGYIYHLESKYESDTRTDPILIQVVEELGEEANSPYAELKIVEIPDDIDWEIDEYDGRESISEAHRSWG